MAFFEHLLGQKDHVHFEIYDITTWLTNKQTIAMHVLPKMSRSKSNQTIKFEQLEECNMKFFVEKYTKCAGEIIPGPLCKKPKLRISLDQ